MRSRNDLHTAELPLLGGVVQQQRLSVPAQVIAALATYRQACRLAYKLRRVRNLTQRDLAAQAELYPSHCSDYFSIHADRRELPAKKVGAVEAVLGNTVISQWLAQQSRITVLEELQADQDWLRRRA